MNANGKAASVHDRLLAKARTSGSDFNLLRIDLVGMLGNSRCPVQIDIGYGDVVTPDPELMRYPPILEGGTFR
jgi:hypothetical protein